MQKSYNHTFKKHQPIILSSIKFLLWLNLLTLLNFSGISLANFKWDAFHDLVPFAQFKKGEKQPWRSVTFIKVAGYKSNIPPWVLFWYQIIPTQAWWCFYIAAVFFCNIIINFLYKYFFQNTLIKYIRNASSIFSYKTHYHHKEGSIFKPIFLVLEDWY